MTPVCAHCGWPRADGVGHACGDARVSRDQAALHARALKEDRDPTSRSPVAPTDGALHGTQGNDQR